MLIVSQWMPAVFHSGKWMILMFLFTSFQLVNSLGPKPQVHCLDPGHIQSPEEMPSTRQQTERVNVHCSIPQLSFKHRETLAETWNLPGKPQNVVKNSPDRFSKGNICSIETPLPSGFSLRRKNPVLCTAPTAFSVTAGRWHSWHSRRIFVIISLNRVKWYYVNLYCLWRTQEEGFCGRSFLACTPMNTDEEHKAPRGKGQRGGKGRRNFIKPLKSKCCSRISSGELEKTNVHGEIHNMRRLMQKER